MHTEGTMVPMNYWNGYCPFRGLPHMPVDDRCPTEVYAADDEVALGRKEGLAAREPMKRGRPKAGEIREKVDPEMVTQTLYTPVVVEGDYCYSCVHDGIREREMGMKVSTYRAPTKKGKKN